MTEFYPARRFPSSDAVRTLGLDPALATRLARHLDRAIARGSVARPSLRETVREAAVAMLLAGEPPEEIAPRLQAVVEEHAHERGWTETSVVTGQPRFALAAELVGRWAALACAAAAGADEELGEARAVG